VHRPTSEHNAEDIVQGTWLKWRSQEEYARMASEEVFEETNDRLVARDATQQRVDTFG
jgi:hypothetical protein